MKGSLYSGSRPSTPSHSSHQNSVSPPQEMVMEDVVDQAESVIKRWDVDHHEFSPVFSGNRKEAALLLEAVAGLQSAMHYYVNLTPNSHKLITAQKLMRIAIKRLEKEFYVILSSNRKNLDSESVSTHSSTSTLSDLFEDEISNSVEQTSDMAMTDLKSIANCMIGSGYGKECVRIYTLIRKSIVDETLYYLGVDKLSHSKIQKMDWDLLETKIKSWLHALRVAVKTLFHGERILCDVVFSCSERISESTFAAISTDAAVTLFGFATNLWRSKKVLSPEKIFRALDMYEAISDLGQEIESVFSHESLAAVRLEAAGALGKIGEAVRVMLAQFEAAIKKDSSKAPSSGGVHPLARYVMNFLVFIADYSGAVSDIIGEFPVSARTPLPEAYFSSPISGSGDDPSAAEITARLAWLVLVLLCKLDAKAVDYNDVALSYLFLANNLNYVVSKIRNSNLGLLIGIEWILKNRSKVNQYLAKYERMGWSEVISSLPDDPTAEISPQEAKERFRRFNQGFEKAYKKQISWVIPDPKVRDEVKISLAKKIVPSYRALYRKHREYYSVEVGVEAIVRYAPEDLDNYLSDLFFADAGGTGGSTTPSYGSSKLSSHGR